MTWLKALWLQHGTKILGIGEALVGLVEFIDQNTVNLVGGFFGPHWGPIVARGIQIGSGLLVARRGYTNSKRA